MSFLYSFGQSLVGSSFPLPELTEVVVDYSTTARVIDVTSRVAAQATEERTDAVGSDVLGLPLTAALANEPIFMRSERGSHGMSMSFASIADFALSDDGDRVEIRYAPGVDVRTIRHLLLDHVLPRVLAYRGQFVIHGAAVDMNGYGLCFLGDTGRGKSTLAASFHNAGYSLLCDDSLAIDAAGNNVVAIPTYPSLRLWPPSLAAVFEDVPKAEQMAPYSEKQRVVLAAASSQPTIPLGAVVLIEEASADPNADIESRALSAREACLALVRNSFQLHLGDTSRVREHLAMAASVSARVPVFSVQYPREFLRLDEVRAHIIAVIASCARTRDQVPRGTGTMPGENA